MYAVVVSEMCDDGWLIWWFVLAFCIVCACLSVRLSVCLSARLRVCMLLVSLLGAPDTCQPSRCVQSASQQTTGCQGGMFMCIVLFECCLGSEGVVVCAVLLIVLCCIVLCGVVFFVCTRCRSRSCTSTHDGTVRLIALLTTFTCH